MLIGRVTIGDEASVWYGAVLRADCDTIAVGERSNVQDGCVVHADTGLPASVGSDVTIGHNATLHGCTVEDLVLIGMGAIVLNGARVGRYSIIAAGTVLPEGQQVPEGVLVTGYRARSGVTCPTQSAQRSSATPPRTWNSPSCIAAVTHEMRVLGQEPPQVRRQAARHCGWEAGARTEDAER